jgi:hypothetical protein
VSVGIKFEVEDIVVSGWPWSAKVCIRLSDRAVAPGRVLDLVEEFA